MALHLILKGFLVGKKRICDIGVYIGIIIPYSLTTTGNKRSAAKTMFRSGAVAGPPLQVCPRQGLPVKGLSRPCMGPQLGQTANLIQDYATALKKTCGYLEKKGTVLPVGKPVQTTTHNCAELGQVLCLLLPSRVGPRHAIWCR